MKPSKQKKSIKLTGGVVYISATLDGYRALEALLAHRKFIGLIVTLPRAKAKNVSDYADFKPLSARHRIPIKYVTDVNALAPELKRLRPTAVIVNGWSQLLASNILKIPAHGCVGTHPSLLPKNRGRAPIAWHFINEERKGGITLFYLDSGCDSGPIIDQKSFAIGSKDNAGSYYRKITKLGASLLLSHFDDIAGGSAKCRPQDDRKATYLLKRCPKDSYLDFAKSARELANLIRAVSDIYPLAFFFYKRNMYTALSGNLAASPEYSGVPGQIAAVSEKTVRVVTGNGILDLEGIENIRGRAIEVKRVFRPGEILNEK